MQKLIQGIHKFQNEDFRPLQNLFEQLSKGQKPETLFITCSDSRIDPSLLTRTQPGELFILRNAGNIIPAHGEANGGEAATVEFAVAALGVKDVIVCGHSHCGAMKGLLDPDSVKSLPAVSSWLSHAETTRRIVLDNYSHLSGAELVAATVEENVLVQLENLKTLPAVASRIEGDDLHLHGWVYMIETGEVFAYDADVEQFVNVAQCQSPGAASSRQTNVSI
ncbi:MAG: carbonic anhydrase [Planctomycetaceae bacterium]|nr:carbonic anhydrase [Planctomycetaceae bacterium]